MTKLSPLASWLHTLPGPFSGETEEVALAKALEAYHAYGAGPELDVDAFRNKLAACGHRCDCRGRPGPYGSRLNYFVLPLPERTVDAFAGAIV